MTDVCFKSGYLHYCAFSMVKQYAWVINTRMCDSLLQSFEFFTIRMGVFYTVLSLLCNYNVNFPLP